MKNHCNTETQSQTGIPNLARINGKSVTFFHGNWLYRVNFDWTLFLVNLFFFSGCDFNHSYMASFQMCPEKITW